MIPNLTPALVVKKASDTTIDVFTGGGWNHWSRFEVSHVKGRLFLKLIKGTPMSKIDYTTLYEQTSKQ